MICIAETCLYSEYCACPFSDTNCISYQRIFFYMALGGLYYLYLSIMAYYSNRIWTGYRCTHMNKIFNLFSLHVVPPRRSQILSILSYPTILSRAPIGIYSPLEVFLLMPVYGVCQHSSASSFAHPPFLVKSTTGVPLRHLIVISPWRYENWIKKLNK